MMRLLLALLLTLIAQSAAAQSLFCVFKLECLDAEACEETEYGFEVIQEAGLTRFETPAETLNAASVQTMGDSVLAFITPLTESGVHLLTVFEDGQARYTNHTWFGAPYAITYHGVCTQAPE